jgi:hypothetical protein
MRFASDRGGAIFIGAWLPGWSKRSVRQRFMLLIRRTQRSFRIFFQFVQNVFNKLDAQYNEEETAQSTGSWRTRASPVLLFWGVAISIPQPRSTKRQYKPMEACER